MGVGFGLGDGLGCESWARAKVRITKMIRAEVRVKVSPARLGGLALAAREQHEARLAPRLRQRRRPQPELGAEGR